MTDEPIYRGVWEKRFPLVNGESVVLGVDLAAEEPRWRPTSLPIEPYRDINSAISCAAYDQLPRAERDLLKEHDYTFGLNHFALRNAVFAAKTAAETNRDWELASHLHRVLLEIQR